MKKGRRFSILVSLTLVLALLATYIPAYAVAVNEDAETILYQEDFNSRELIPGETVDGWYFYRTAGSNATAEIKDGALYFYGTTNTVTGSYDSLRLNVEGSTEWTNYTVEADITYLKSSGWYGLCYNMSGDTTYQKGTIARASGTATGNCSLNGLVNNTWVNNNNANTSGVTESTLNVKAYATNVGANDTFRIRITNNGAGTSVMSYALYNADGTLETWSEVMSVSNIDAQTTKGSIGFMLGAKANATDIKVDNITVTQEGNVLYEEDFNSVSLVPGETVNDWYFYQTAGSNATAEMKDGALYFYGTTNTEEGSYDSLRLEVSGSSGWTNYTVEADITYLRSSGWSGLCYNVSGNATYQKGTIPMSGNCSLNGLVNSAWVNNVSGTNRVAYTDCPTQNETFRLKIVNDGGSTSTLYHAAYNNGVLGEYVQVMSVDNIDSQTTAGTIGLMMGAKANATDIKVDNIKVTRNAAASNVDPAVGGDIEDLIVGIDTEILYQEDFTGEAFSLTANNEVNDWYFYKTSGSEAAVEVRDGALYFTGSSTSSGYDIAYLTTAGSGAWTDYTVEADVTYLSDSGWYGLCYNVGGNTTWQKGTLSIGNTTASSLNGYVNAWVNNDSSTNKRTFDTGIEQGKAFRMRIVSDGGSNAAMYFARYENGVLGAYQEALTVSNIDSRTQSGAVGVMLGSGSNAASVRVDNIVVYKNPETATPTPYVGKIAEIYVPETGIVNPPVVIQEVTSVASYASVGFTRPAIAMMEIDGNLNVLASGGTAVGTVSGFMGNCGGSVIPAFVVDSSAEVTALTAYLNTNNIIDAYVIAESNDSSLVKTAREACPKVRGALIFDSLETAAARKAAFVLVNQSLGYVAISRTAPSDETVTYFNARVMPVWGYAEGVADVYDAIVNGYGGVISNGAGMVYDVYEEIIETTVSGRPLPIGHRGHSEYPEMTISSFYGAIAAGAKAVEVDLRLTKDGEIVLMHDAAVTRTTNGLGTVETLTLAELKELYVGEPTDLTDEIPTLEEVFAEFQNTDLVFYCEMKVKNDTLMNRFNALVQQYGYQDRAIVFISYGARATYNYTNMTPGLAYTAASTTEQLILENDQDCIEAFIKQLTPYNYQTLYYNFNGHATESFYYSLAARGFVSAHSTTNGRAKLNNTLLTGLGAISVLTDELPRCEGFYYRVDAQDMTLVSGQALPLENAVAKLVNSDMITCGFTQISGPELVWDENLEGYTLVEVGEVVLVYYADVTVNGAAYRVYSPAVTVQFSDAE